MTEIMNHVWKFWEPEVGLKMSTKLKFIKCLTFPKN